MICHRCGTDIHLSRIPARLDTCHQCGAYLHCCLNCRFYDPTMANSCQEPQAEYVNEKAAANFCEFFQPGTKVAASGREAARQDAKKALDALFKDLD